MTIKYHKFVMQHLRLEIVFVVHSLSGYLMKMIHSLGQLKQEVIYLATLSFCYPSVNKKVLHNCSYDEFSLPMEKMLNAC